VRDNNIKVVITGEASDEILFGYDSYKELKLLRFWAKAPQSSVRPLLIKRLYPHLRHYADAKAYGLMKLYYEDFLDTITNPLAGLNIRIRNNTVLAAALNKDHLVKYNQDDLIALRTRKGVHRIVPGITGWAQVNGRDTLPIPVKVDFDEYYLKNRSFMFDLKILWITFAKVLRTEGVQH